MVIDPSGKVTKTRPFFHVTPTFTNLAISCSLGGLTEDGTRETGALGENETRVPPVNTRRPPLIRYGDFDEFAEKDE